MFKFIKNRIMRLFYKHPVFYQDKLDTLHKSLDEKNITGYIPSGYKEIGKDSNMFTKVYERRVVILPDEQNVIRIKIREIARILAKAKRYYEMSKL
jgi:hypothetical protein